MLSRGLKKSKRLREVMHIIESCHIPLPEMRLRRLRQHAVLRDLIRETVLNLQDFIFPLFIKGIAGVRRPILSMPGHDQIPLHVLHSEIEELVQLGIHAVLLFGIPVDKDSQGTRACYETGIIQEAIRIIKSIAPKMLVITDLCLCEYTDHGHCGVLSERSGQYDVDNDTTLELLVKQAISHAQAGVDMVAPSGMIDGMVRAIRYGLDQAGFAHLPILSYSMKYQSAFYGPFRVAAEGAPSFGDRSTHQADPANAQEALREVLLDVEEGADMLMVKPAHAYLDVICRVKQAYPMIPLAAYHTSGEFAMIKAAAAQGWVDERKAVLEVLTGIRRAGADCIISYYTKEIAQKRWLESV
jgi:porphobilinogen synthase